MMSERFWAWAVIVVLAAAVIAALLAPDRLEGQQVLSVRGDTVTVRLVPARPVDNRRPIVGDTLPFPRALWDSVGACAAANGVPVDARVPPPTVIVIHTGGIPLEVHDSLVDSLTGYRVIAHPAAIGYSFMQQRVIVVVDALRLDYALLRHEALHFFLWAGRHAMGHPAPFPVCSPIYPGA